jgi:hypothetical protein
LITAFSSIVSGLPLSVAAPPLLQEKRKREKQQKHASNQHFLSFFMHRLHNIKLSGKLWGVRRYIPAGYFRYFISKHTNSTHDVESKKMMLPSGL